MTRTLIRPREAGSDWWSRHNETKREITLERQIAPRSVTRVSGVTLLKPTFNTSLPRRVTSSRYSKDIVLVPARHTRILFYYRKRSITIAACSVALYNIEAVTGWLFRFSIYFWYIIRLRTD